ncbi:MAG: hypothetical protein WDW38_007723 [Sanguina aurantia]
MSATTKSKPRGELAELTASLQSLCTTGKRSDKELRSAKKDVFKKVVSYMTLGMDMSGLFPSMTSCANLSPDDIVLKKMLYLYLGHYATQTPDLALLTMNQLHKDCQDEDPTIRGLALRTLCSLRVPNFLEYVTAPVNAGLEDRHPYVRRTAVMGVLKLHHIDAGVVQHQGMVERVRRMLYNDPDAQVVANCLVMFMQVEGCKKLAERQLVYSLLNRLKEFSEWSQCHVLELTSFYTPGSEAEVYDILNVLEDRLGSPSSAIVLAAVKVFLHHTINMTATHQQVLERIKDPLKSLISRDDPATVYVVLCHVLLLVQRAPFVFEADYVAFFCRTHDPAYIKKVKMEVLSHIACASNVYDIVSELTEYARDISPALGREAVCAVGRIALAVQDVSGIVERLLGFLDSGADHIIAETLVQMKDLLRRYPDMAEVCIGQISDLSLAAISEPDAKAALIWMLGTFGQAVQSAPYQLEALVETFSSEAPNVRLALLTAAVQLFFKRPPETKVLLGGLLSAGIADSHTDVHDRALMYYRLLRADPGEAANVIAPPLMAVSFFSDKMTQEARDRIFEEFNSLSVVYAAPASSFEDQRAYHSMAPEEQLESGADMRPDILAAEAPELLGDEATNLLGDFQADLLDLDSAAPSPPPALQPRRRQPHPHVQLLPAPQATTRGTTLTSSYLPVDATATTTTTSSSSSQQQRGAPAAPARPVLDYIDDLLGGGGGLQHTAGGAAPSAAPSSQPQPQLHLNPQARLGAGPFQAQWKALAVSHTYQEVLSPATVSALASNNHKDFCAHMTQAYINTMASGGAPPNYKYYFYSVMASGSSLLVEMVVRTDTCTATMTFKAQEPELMPQFLELWSNCLMGFHR